MTAVVIVATLCHVVNGDRLLLKRATRGISKGKWNAPGGKLSKTETPPENAKREVLEETGLKVRNLTYHGILRYYMRGKTELHTKAYLFSTQSFRGKSRSTAEGRLRWFNHDKLPFESMWPDDKYWINLMLMGERFNAKFYFDKKNVKVVRFELASREGSDLEVSNRKKTRRARRLNGTSQPLSTWPQPLEYNQEAHVIQR